VAREVLLGKYDAGALSDIKSREYEELGLRVIATSDPVPSSPIVVHRGIDPKMVEAVRRILQGVEAHGKHQTLVKPWDQELAYGVMETRDSDYEGLRELVRRFGLVELREIGQGNRR
jgi:phosphonate transport system substrate-binding protein